MYEKEYRVLKIKKIDSGFVRIYFINGRKCGGYFSEKLSEELGMKFMQILKMSNEIYTLEIE